MIEHQFDIGVIVARKKLKSPWTEHAWLPYTVLPAVPSAACWTSRGTDGEHKLFYVGHSVLTLHASETAHSGRPSLWVSLPLLSGDACGICKVTADPYEGEALTEGIGGILEGVPAATENQAPTAGFFGAFPVDRPVTKRDRHPADPQTPGRRPA